MLNNYWWYAMLSILKAPLQSTRLQSTTPMYKYKYKLESPFYSAAVHQKTWPIDIHSQVKSSQPTMSITVQRTTRIRYKCNIEIRFNCCHLFAINWLLLHRCNVMKRNYNCPSTHPHPLYMRVSSVACQVIYSKYISITFYLTSPWNHHHSILRRRQRLRDQAVAMENKNSVVRPLHAIFGVSSRVSCWEY